MYSLNVEIPFNYTPRDYQVPLLDAMDSGILRACCVYHRRAGKDKTCLNHTIKKMFQRVGVYYYIFPTYAQAKKTIWDGIDGDGFPFLEHFPEEIRKSTNQAEMKIKLINGSLFQLIGSDNIDSIMGPNPIGCVFSEYSLQDPKAWDLIRPILKENGGWAIFIYTSRGHNHGYDMYNRVKNNPRWFCDLLTIEDTGAMTKEQVQEEIDDGMDEDLAQQEFYCSFEASNPGAYYSNQIKQAKEQNRVRIVPIEPNIPVNTFWDLGFDDANSIWLVQDIGREIHVIGCYSNFGEALSHYANWLIDWRNSHGVVFGKHVLPHDGKAVRLETGKSVYMLLQELGFDCDITIRPKDKYKDGIEAVRQIFSRCYFDEENCNTVEGKGKVGETNGLEALSQYRKEYSEKNKIWSNHPVHDWSSHLADAFQTLALWYQAQLPPAPKQDYFSVNHSGAAHDTAWMGV